MSPRPPKLTYNIGDPVWINVCCQGRVHGHVIAEYTLADDPATKYIIRIEDPEYPHEEVRDALLMSPAEDEVVPSGDSKVGIITSTDRRH